MVYVTAAGINARPPSLAGLHLPNMDYTLDKNLSNARLRLKVLKNLRADGYLSKEAYAEKKKPAHQ